MIIIIRLFTALQWCGRCYKRVETVKKVTGEMKTGKELLSLRHSIASHKSMKQLITARCQSSILKLFEKNRLV